MNLICVACKTPNMHFVRKIASRRRKQELDLFFCAKCETFAMPSDFTQQISNPDRAIAFHRKVLERNISWSHALFDFIDDLALDFHTVHEIGCGSGATLHVAKTRGTINAIGFEMNPHVIAFGKNRFKLDLRQELWTPDADIPPADLILSLSVLEHLNDPRSLISSIADHCREHDSIAVLSTPLVRRSRWRYVFTPYEEGSPFNSADSHVLFFSPGGFISMLENQGAKTIKYKKIFGWNLHFTAFSDKAANTLEGLSSHFNDQ